MGTQALLILCAASFQLAKVALLQVWEGASKKVRNGKPSHGSNLPYRFVSRV